MKKNVIAIVAAVALVLLAVPTIAFANGMQQTWCPSGGVGSLAHHAMRAAGDSDAGATVGAAIATVRGEYVDRNNDGVCDNYGVGKGANGQGSCAGYADADGDGICDNCANGQGSCPGYADADGNGVCDNYSWAEAISLLRNNRVVILSAGTGNPFFTTDSAACLRGIEIEADVVLKATKVDGVFTADPAKDPSATMYDQLTYSEVLEKELKVMDLAAFTLARDHKLPIRVFNMNKPGALRRVVMGEKEGTLITE